MRSDTMPFILAEKAVHGLLDLGRLHLCAHLGLHEFQGQLAFPQQHPARHTVRCLDTEFLDFS